MANRLRTWVRRVTPPTTRALARRVAIDMLDRVTVGAGRIAETLRPALPAAPSPRSELQVSPAKPVKPVKPVKRKTVAPEDLGWALARHVSTGVETQVAAMLADGLSPAAHDPQAVRLMRVGSRRLRSFVALFGPWQGKKLQRRLEKQLKEITGALGPLRDLDVVLTELSGATQQADPLRRAAAEQIAARLGKRLGRTRKRAARALRDTDVGAFQRDIADARRRVVERLTGTPDIRADIATVLGTVSASAFKQTPVPTTLEDREAVHEVRILAKRLRYAHGWVKPAMQHGPGAGRLLKRAQRTVGASRDLDLLIERLSHHEVTLREEGQGVLAYALTDWRHEAEQRRSAADTKILPALTDLSHRTVTRLTLDALGLDRQTD
ncbi:MAG: CHAD domain-containing protein [Nannocystales bacterium]